MCAVSVILVLVAYCKHKLIKKNLQNMVKTQVIWAGKVLKLKVLLILLLKLRKERNQRQHALKSY